MSRLTRWIHNKRHKDTGKKYVDMSHDEQIEAVKETMHRVNWMDNKAVGLSQNDMTILACALTVYINLIRGYYNS